MQAEKEIDVVFWDRLKGLKRVKESGEVVLRGSEYGENILKIRRWDQGYYYITASCYSQALLSANMNGWPSKVSEDGLTIHLWLFDHSLGRNGFKREFILTFFDELGATGFFDVYTAALPTRVGRNKPSYWDMREGGVKELNDDEGIKEEAEKEKKNDGEDVVADVAEVDDEDQALADMFALEESNWGESQSLFNPLMPFDKKK